MAFIGDTTPIKLQLKLTNYAEALESKPRHHVRRISFISTILDECRADDVVDYAKALSAEDQEELNWQARTENLQNDVEVRNTLTSLSGRLCPNKNISLSLFDKVTDNDTHQQRTGPYPLSAYRQVSFRRVMLTKHSGDDGQVQLLFWYDGLPEDRSCLRWRSHDYIKLVLPKARPFYIVFWVVQWDVVDMTDRIDEGHVATSPGTGLGINYWRLCLDHSASERQGNDSGKFSGTRHRKERKSPWVAEVKPKRSKKKISLGSYKTRKAAARAADAGRYYYGLDGLNFPDSPRFLEEIPLGLDDKAKKEFVKAQAHRLAKLTEMPCTLRAVPGAVPGVHPVLGFCPTWISESRSYNTNMEGFTSRSIDSGNNFGSDNMRPATNASFAGLPRPGDFATPSMDSGSDLGANLDGVRPSTSYGTDIWRETVGGWPDQENLWLSNNRFTSNSQVSARDLCPEIHQEDTSERSPLPVFDVLSYPDENSEPDISNNIAGHSPTDIASEGISDSNDSRLHHETESQTASHGYDSSLLVAESEQAEPNGDWARDSVLFCWLQSEMRGI